MGADVMLGCLVQINFRTQPTTHYLTSCKCLAADSFHLSLCLGFTLAKVHGPSGHLCVARQAPLSMEYSRQETGVDCHFLLQGIFPTQGLNPCLLRCRRTLNCWVTGEAQGIPPTLKFPEATHIGQCETMKT